MLTGSFSLALIIRKWISWIKKKNNNMIPVSFTHSSGLTEKNTVTVYH